MKKLFCFINFFLLFNSVQAYSNLTIYDPIGERVLYGVNNEEKKLIASTTKIMTSIVTLENSNLDSEFSITKEDINTYGSSIYLKEKDNIKVRDLLYGLMLRSGNDAALTLANHIYGYDTFINLMNSKAYYLGMKNTTFSNPHGLDDETKNYSTTDDMAKLMSYAIKNNEFLKITLTNKYKYNGVDWYNKNELLGYYKYSISGKTGYTPNAGYTYVSSALKDNKYLVIATFGDKDRFNTHKNLYKKYFDMYNLYTIIDKNTFYINNGKYKDMYLYIKNSYSMLLSDKEKDNIKIDIYLYEEEYNNKYGYISIKLDNEEVHREYIYGIKYIQRKKSIIKSIKSLFNL